MGKLHPHVVWTGDVVGDIGIESNNSMPQSTSPIIPNFHQYGMYFLRCRSALSPYIVLVVNENS